MAIAAGRRLAHRLFDNKPDLKLSYDNIATVVFSHPVIGTVGMTEGMMSALHSSYKVVQKVIEFNVLAKKFHLVTHFLCGNTT